MLKASSSKRGDAALRAIAIQAGRVRRRSPRVLTSPPGWIAPPDSSNFSAKVVLPVSGCEMIAKVHQQAISSVKVDMPW